MTATYLNLELVENGSLKSLIGDDGRIWATGSNSPELLREAAYAARDAEYTTIMIGTQTWDVAQIIATDFATW